MFRYMLAPMENFTDPAFRTLCFNHGADLTFTEFVSPEGLANKVKETWNLIELKDSTPTQIQLLAKNEEKLASFLKKTLNQLKGFRSLILNTI